LRISLQRPDGALEACSGHGAVGDAPLNDRNPALAGASRWAGQDSNLRQTDYESAALTN
jgi:hypothetical protein